MTLALDMTITPAEMLVEQMILDRAPKLAQRPRLWRLLREIGYPVLGYDDAVSLVEAVAPLSADACFEWGQEMLRLKVETAGFEHIPADGPVVLIGNHPGGIADGVALWNVIKDKRPDLCFLANRDALKICPGLSERIIPVEWRRNAESRKRSRETLRGAMEALNQGRCLTVFPAGRMADWSWRKWRIADPAWAPTAISLARRFNAPIVPMGVTQTMPLLYYALAQINEELRDITIFHGLMRQRGKTYRLSFGDPVPARDWPGDEKAATDVIKSACERLAWGRG